MNWLRFGMNTYFLKSEPISLVHFVTQRCTARCKHCFIDFNKPEKIEDELTVGQIEEMTKYVGQNLFNVNLTGGEPFSRDDLSEIVLSYDRNTPVLSFVITTNGILLDAIRVFLKKITEARLKARVKISVSIDNFEEKHDANRGLGGAFKKALDTYYLIQSYQNDRILADVVITITPDNYNDVASLYQYLMGKGVGSFTVILMREEGVVTSIPGKDKIAVAYRDLTNSIHANQRKRSLRGANFYQETVVLAKNHIVNKILAGTYIKPRFIMSCTAGSLFATITSGGNVYPCEILRERCLGNLRDYGMDFMRLWHSEKGRNIRMGIRDTQCHCTFECPWSTNIISTLRFIPSLLGFMIYDWQ